MLNFSKYGYYFNKIYRFVVTLHNWRQLILWLPVL